MRPIHEYDSAVSYLVDRLAVQGPRSGLRLRAAEAAQCHPAYVSRVTQGRASLSLEQAERLATFFALGPDETHYFLLLVQRERAGSPGLRRYLDQQLDAEREKRLDVKRRVASAEVVTAEHEGRYYSRWLYAAVHVLLAVPTLATPEALAARLHVSRERVREALTFLVEAGLAVEEAGRYAIGPKNVHLGRESRHVARHHTNWRLQAVQAIDRGDADALHYSAVATLSEADALRVRQALLEALEKCLATIRSSPEEDGFVLALDFFRLAPR